MRVPVGGRDSGRIRRRARSSRHADVRGVRGRTHVDVPRWRRENSVAADDFRTWAITDDTDELLGLVSVFTIDYSTHTGEIGVRVMPDVRGGGVARAAVDQALARVASERGVRRVEAWHAVGNVASCRVTAACGFEFEAEFPAHHPYGDGALHDEHLHVRVLDGPDPRGA